MFQVKPLLCWCSLSSLVVTLAVAQTSVFPEKTIHLVVPFAAGSATDQLARALSVEINAETKTPLVVDNKPGANGNLAAQFVAQAPADGYTIFITTNTTQAANPHLFKTLSYDPVKDYAPISGLNNGGAQVMLISGASSINNLVDFIAAAKNASASLNYGHGSSTARVAAEMLQQMANIKLQQIPYKSNVFAITDLLGKQIDMTITDLATGIPQIKSGKLKALAVSSLTRSSLLPEVPTMDESGLKGYELAFWSAAYAPAKTPLDVINRLNTLISKASLGVAMQNYYAQTGSQRFITKPEELASFQEAETQKWGKVIRAAGIDKE